MLRLMQGTHSKVAKQDDLILWSLQSMYVLLKRGECTQDDFKVDNFIKAKDGSPSWIAQCLVQQLFMEHIHSLVDGVREVDLALADKLNDEVLSKLADPMLYDSTFPMQDKDCIMEEAGQADESRDVLFFWRGVRVHAAVAREIAQGGSIIGRGMQKVL